MTTEVALWIAAIVAAVVAADLAVFDWDLHVLAGKALLRLTDYLAFWR